MPISFDGTLNLGAIINALVLLVGFVVTFTRVGGRIDLLTMRVKALEEAISDSKMYDRRITTLEERLTNQSNLLNDLRKVGGRGHA